MADSTTQAAEAQTAATPVAPALQPTAPAPTSELVDPPSVKDVAKELKKDVHQANAPRENDPPVIGVDIVPDRNPGGPESDLRFSQKESSEGSVLDGLDDDQIEPAYVEAKGKK